MIREVRVLIGGGVALRDNLIGLAVMLVSLDWLHAECARNHSWASSSLA